LLLYGKGHPEYGERTDENLLNLLENFSGATEPAITVTGMLWHKEVLYFYDTVGTTFYVASLTGGSPLWEPITLFGSGVTLPTASTPGLVDGAYYHFLGSPDGGLYQWSSDERNIDGWMLRLSDSGAGDPNTLGAVPTKELQLYDGSAWNVIPDASAVMTSYLRLDTTNGPLTGDLTISKSTPVLSLAGANASIQMGAGSPLDWEIAVNTQLEFRSAGTSYLQIGTNGVLSVTLASYETVISANNDIPNKKYVDDLFSGAVIGDTFVNAGTFGIVGSPTSGTITLNYSTTGSPGPSGALYITGVDSDNIPFVSRYVGGTEYAATVDDALTFAAPTNNPTFVGNVTVPNLTGASPSTNAANKAYVDAAVTAAASGTTSAAQRWIAGVTDSEIGLGLTQTFTLPFFYTAGTNRLMVYKNGIKLYHDNIAYDDAVFGSALLDTTSTSGLTLYTVVGVVTGPSGTWILDGDHTAEINVGDTFQIQNDAGGGSPSPNTSYTVASVTLDASPARTHVTVTGTIDGTAVGNGQLGLDYAFNLYVDGIGSPGIHEVGPINAFDAQTYGDLVTAMQTAVNAVFGAGVATVFLMGNAIRIQSGQLPGTGVAYSHLVGSPAPRDLFGPTNLAVYYFYRNGTPVAGTTLGYYESDGYFDLSPLTGGGLVAPGTVNANVVTLNDAVSGSDVLEFILT